MASLIVQQSGARSGGPITGRVLIGRLPTNGIVLNDSNVSRMHAWIDLDPQGNYFVADNGSLTGTWVNGSAVEKRQSLADGDVVRIGHTQIVFSTEDELPAGVTPIDLSGQPPKTNVEDAGVMFDCPCGAPIWFKAAAIGQAHHCRHCGRTLRIPSIPGSVAETISAAVIAEPGVPPTPQMIASEAESRAVARNLYDDEHGLGEVGNPGPVQQTALAIESRSANMQLPVDPAPAQAARLPSLFQHRQPVSAPQDDESASDSAAATAQPPAPQEVQTCSICHSPITAGEAQTTCPACALTFHTDCWKENFGCSAYGCAQVGILKSAEPAAPAMAAAAASDPTPLPAGEPEDAAPFPWEFAFLGISVIGALMGTLVYGVPAAIGAIGNMIYLAAFSTGSKRRSIAVLALLICLVGAGLGVYASYIFWNGWPPIGRHRR